MNDTSEGVRVKPCVKCGSRKVHLKDYDFWQVKICHDCGYHEEPIELVFPKDGVPYEVGSEVDGVDLRPCVGHNHTPPPKYEEAL